MVYKPIKIGKFPEIQKYDEANKCKLVFVVLIITLVSAAVIWYNIMKLEVGWIWYKSNKCVNRNESDVVVCYYNLPDPQVANDSQLMPSSIHPHLCTHINVAFGQIRNKKVYLNHSQYQYLREIVKMKKHNPKLKILLSVGGAGNHNGFSEMVINHAARKIFIRSIKDILRNYSLDGIDLDWEFPSIKDYQEFSKKRERQHFSQLLREIRAEYNREKRNYLLTVAVAAPQIIVDVAYDVDQINMYTDFVNIMTYDFHTYTRLTPFTGLNSPLYTRSDEQLYLGTLNINYTVQMYLNKGLEPRKIVVGVPTYGHSFTLVNLNNTKIGSPASGFGVLGNLGFVNFPDICMILKNFQNNTRVVEEMEAKVPYLSKESEWVSYDDPQSVMAKATFIRDNNLRGAMIYSLNADDYDGVCERLTGRVKFPLAFTIKNTLIQNEAP